MRAALFLYKEGIVSIIVGSSVLFEPCHVQLAGFGFVS
jgi:hypothetical protein